MKTIISFLAVSITLSSLSITLPQDQNEKGIFVEPKDGYYQDVILKSIDEFNNPEKEKKKIFQLDFSGMDLPTSKDQFKAFLNFLKNGFRIK